MGRHGSVHRSRADASSRPDGDLPKRQPGDRVRPRPLDPAAQSGLFAFLDENSGTFWAAYYAALATTSTTASRDALRRSSSGGRELPPARYTPPALESGTAAPDGRGRLAAAPGEALDPFPSDLRFGMPRPARSSGEVPLRRRRSLFERPDDAPNSLLPDCPACGDVTEITFLDLESSGMKVVCSSCATEVELDHTTAEEARPA